MSLSGKLDVFPLEEVLRLLARSHQIGCLRVEGEGAGRIYMEAGSLTYATVEGDDAFREQLLASGVVSEEGLNRLDVSQGALTEALAPSAAASALTELIREHSVESLYRIRRPGYGHFEFVVDSRPRYATGQAFDVETIISEAERRAADWADIETVVPDLTSTWHMVPELEEDSVNLSDSAWRFLAAMDGACSVDVLAGRLGLTTFQTARRMAELSRARLVEPTSVSHTPEASVITYDEVEQPISEPDPEAESEPPTEERSWWAGETYEPEESPVSVDTYETSAEEYEDEPSEDFAPAEEGGDDSFLETVFGELEKSEDTEEHEDPEDGGFGLLRRRGLGAAFRELADS